MKGEEITTKRNVSLSPALLGLMALACGVSVANPYYNQPLLGDFASYFRVSPWEAGLVATAAQVGYGVGLFFFLPLGDLLERRRLVLFLLSVCTICLIGVALSPSLPFLIATQFLVGLTAISPQILIPLGSEMVPEKQRGKTIGTLMTGLLGGLLLARAFAGIVGDHFGWRIVYVLAAFFTAALVLALRASLPHRPPSLRLSYGRLMHSMIALAVEEPLLRKSALVSALSFASFAAFWTALSFLMADKFHMGASEAGLLGVVGLVGALGAPWAGRLSDHKGVAFTITIALGLSLLSFVLMEVWISIPGLIAGVVLMDLGVQSVQVAAQARVLSLRPDARSRLNTLYMVARFTGGASGSALGAIAWTWAGWSGVSGFCLGLSLIAMAVHLIGKNKDAVPAAGGIRP